MRNNLALSVFLVLLEGVSIFGEANPAPFRASKRGKFSTGANLFPLEAGVLTFEADDDGPKSPSTPESASDMEYEWLQNIKKANLY